MVCANPDGEHMSLETFAKVLGFVVRYPLEVLMISGGEPLDHPDFFKMVEMAKECELPLILILSNGMFAEDDELLEKVKALELPVQITNDPRFYPKRVKRIDHPLFTYEDTLRVLTPLGRAKDNDVNIDGRFAPMCFNLRSIVRSLGSFSSALLYLRQSAKFCTPSINVDGSIVGGESPTCYKIGTVESTEEELVENLLSVDCNRCGLEDGLEDKYREAIGLPEREEEDVWTMPII